MPGLFGCFTVQKHSKKATVQPSPSSPHSPDLTKAPSFLPHRESLKSTVFDSVSDLPAAPNRRQSQRVMNNKPLVQYVFPRNKSMEKL